MRINRRVRAVAAVSALVVAGCTATGATASTARGTAATRASTAGNAAGAGTIEPADGGWRVTLHLATPVPPRDARPVLAVDGRPVGVAQSPDGGRTLTLVSNDSHIRPNGHVTLWNPSGSPAVTGTPDSTTISPASIAPSFTVPSDPGSNGPYAVTQREYDLGDQAIALSGLSGNRVELRGHVYEPQNAPGKRPLVVFLHGRHEFCFGPAPIDFANPWPCPAGDHPIPSYRGYDAPALALASHGYLVVSISADAINALDFLEFDGGALARAQLVLAHLDLWKQWSTVGGGPFGTHFVGHVDLNNIGLMGHSRGGEGVVRAALLNAALPHPYGIRAIVALAPTDFARPTIPGVATTVILPYCDGDVIDLEGQYYFDDTRYAVAGDDAFRSTELVMGANHNFFNTEWTPGLSVAPSFDDWFGDPNSAPCGTATPTRLKPAEQQSVGRAYIAGFFRLVLGNEQSMLPYFDGSSTHAASTGKAVVDTVAQFPASARRDVVRFDGANSLVSTGGALRMQRCSGVALGGFPPPPANGLPPCTTGNEFAAFPGWIPAFFVPDDPTATVTHVQWSSTSGRINVALPAGKQDLRGFTALTVRMAPDLAAGGSTDLTIRFRDAAGHTADVAVSKVSDALQALPGNDFGLPKTILREVRVPLSSLRTVDRAHITTVQLLTNRVAHGAVFVADLALVRTSTGHSGPIVLPRISVADTTVTEGGDGLHRLRFRLTMSKPSTRAVRVFADPEALAPDSTPTAHVVVFPPGKTAETVAVPFLGNTRDTPDVTIPIVLATPTDAIVDRSIAMGTILDDDPSPILHVSGASATEGPDAVIKFPISLSAPSDNFIIINAQVVDGTAKMGQDIEPQADVFGFFSPGATTGTINVNLIDDAVHEPTETFTLKVLPSEGVVLSSPTTVTGTIFDND